MGYQAAWIGHTAWALMVKGGERVEPIVGAAGDALPPRSTDFRAVVCSSHFIWQQPRACGTEGETAALTAMVHIICYHFERLHSYARRLR
jgi:hypothetical protein